MADYEERKCWNHFKERLAVEIKQFCVFEASYPDILDPKDVIDKFCDQCPEELESQPQVTLKERISKSEYKMSMKSDVSIRVVSVGRFTKAVVRGGVGGAAVGVVGGMGAGAGVGALIGSLGGPIGAAIGTVIGGGVGAAVGGVAGIPPGAGIGGWAAKRFGKDIMIPMHAIIPQIGEVQIDSKTGEMTVKVKISSTYRYRHQH